ncbi:MAG: phosphoenolpyruvate--protein phosphotransferase [Deltaproteobacteria bacterium]|jgi:phosphotransferase system enzyme I (PtsI)|nr:phosphoenolpyruvate--protein phosphotransferase [Deltaproteobacteria bacterium]
MRFKGVAGSPGVGIGFAALFEEPNLDWKDAEYLGIEGEKNRLNEAIATFKEDVTKLANQALEKHGKGHSDILKRQISLVRDPFFLQQINDLIDGGKVAEAAVNDAAEACAEIYRSTGDERIMERITDIMDARTRLLTLLLKVETLDPESLPPQTVLVGKDIPASTIAVLNLANIAALVPESGGFTSHGAIMARAFGIPLVTGLKGVFDSVKNGDRVIVDGNDGEVVTAPDEETLATYMAKRQSYLEDQKSLNKFINLKTLDADGQAHLLFANIGGINEAKVAKANGAEGVGLFRTEFLFLDRATLPSEEEQFRIYSEVAGIFAPNEVVVRTLDVGGDKNVPALKLPKEDNPFLGYRAIRYCLNEPEVFMTQLRAILRAGAKDKNLSIMLPFVTSVDEVSAARKILETCKDELKAKGQAYDEGVKLGIMVETPAAVFMAEELTQVTDFFSIGTNDLAQYTLAADRGNAKLAKLCSPFHPAVLKGLKKVIEAGKKAKKLVGLCGESGANPQMIPILLALGLDEFSVSPSSVLRVRREIARWDMERAKALTRDVLSLTTTEAITDYLKEALKTAPRTA